MNEIKIRQQATYREIIDNISSIKFITFDADTSWAAPLVYGDEDLTEIISLIDRQETSHEQQLQWIIDILKEYQITGECLLGFVGAVYAKVDLGNTYDWLEPIWEIGHSIRFIPLGNSFRLHIQWTESCIGGNCIRAILLRNLIK